MEEYLNKSKISGDIFRFLYLNKQSSRQEIAQSLGISFLQLLVTLMHCRNLVLLKMPENSNPPEGEKQLDINVSQIPDMRLVLISLEIIFLSY